MFIDIVIAFSYRILRTFIGGEGVVRKQKEENSFLKPISSCLACDMKGVRQPGKVLSGPIFSILFQIYQCFCFIFNV